jgi:hypothetical protein
MNLYLLRYPNDQGTPGDLIINRARFCHTLEDVVRSAGKIPGVTAIPAGRYPVIVDWSPKFKKLTPHILNVPGFSNVRIHGGNTVADTDGCVLCGYKIADVNNIYNRASDDLTDALKPNEPHWIEIFNAWPYFGAK